MHVLNALIGGSPPPLRAYWAYHGHFPSNAQLLFDSLDTSVQKHINDERVAMERHSNGAPPTASLSSNSLHPPLSRKKRPLPSHAHSDAGTHRIIADQILPTLLTHHWKVL